MRILITGANGQLGYEFQQLEGDLSPHVCIFADRSQMDLSDSSSIDTFLRSQPRFDCIINCAAYTQVDKAETEIELAIQVNASAVAQLAKYCQTNDSILIHFSTDYVFDGQSSQPYKTNHTIAPINLYGRSKREGEVAALHNPKTYIIRTSWVYSTHGHNFVKTMLRLAQEKPALSIVQDQVGSPTYAADLARAVVKILQSPGGHYGIYHYSNSGSCTWYDFARQIFAFKNIEIPVTPITSTAFPTPAKRPAYSVLDCTDIVTTFAVEQPSWQDALQRMLQKL